MRIEKGKQYECIKDLVMTDGKKEFIKGKVYISEIDNNLVNESGNKRHGITEGYCIDFFKPYVDAVLVNSDPINPDHYKSYSVETIDMMVAIYGKEKVAIHCELTAFKYRQRMGKKDNLEQDLAKEKWYLDKAKELRSVNGETKKVSKMDIALHLGIDVEKLEIVD